MNFTLGTCYDYCSSIQQRKNPNVFPKEGDEVKARVKVIGDGAAFSRSSNLILLSYSLLDLKDEVLAGKGSPSTVLILDKF